MTSGLNGSSSSSSPVLLAPITTLAQQDPPQLSSSTLIAAVSVGPYSCVISGVQQDKPGLLYIIITVPANQSDFTVRLARLLPHHHVPMRLPATQK